MNLTMILFTKLAGSKTPETLPGYRTGEQKDSAC